MRAVQFEEVEPGPGGTPGGRGELLAEVGELGARQLARGLAVWPVRDPGGGHQRPVALVQGLVDALPHQFGRALAAAVAELYADRGAGCLGVHEVGDPPPGLRLPSGVDAGAAGGDPPLRGHAHHLGHHQPGTAEGPRAQVDEVEVAGQAVGGRVHVHGRDDDPVAQGQAAQSERREHRGCAGRAAELALRGLGEVGVPQAEVVVGDAAAAGEEVEGELAGRLVEVPAEVLEPLQAGAGGPLGGGDDGPAFLLVGRQGPSQRRLFLQAGGQCQGVLDGELGAGADGEVGGVRGVAQQDHVAVRPALVDHRTEGGPGGLVGPERPAPQRVREDLGAAVGRLPLVALLEARRPPHLLAHLDDHGGGVGGVRIAVQLHHTVLGLDDLEAEGVEGEVGGEPDVAAPVGGHPGPEDLGVGLAGGAVDAVGGDDEVVGLREPGRVGCLGGEAQSDAEFMAALVQDLEESSAAQGGEPVASGGVAGAPVDDVDVVPAGEVPLQGRVDRGVGVLDAAEGLVGEDHSEAEGVVGGVAFPDGDLTVGAETFQQGGGVQTARAAADDRDGPCP